METTGEREQQELRIGPTVTKDKWLNHAKSKLSRGYVLIVGRKRKTANFHSSAKGYEMCSYQVARQLIKDGTVRKVREHHLGDVYELIALPDPAPLARPRPSASTDEEFEALLDDLDADMSNSATASFVE